MTTGQLFVDGKGQYTYKHNNEALSFINHICSGKAISITYSECVFVATFNQHAMRMRHIILPSVTCPAVPCFSTLSHKRHDFRKKIYWTQNVFCYSLHLVPETFLNLRRIQQRIIINVLYQSSCKVATGYSCQIWMNVELSRQIFDKYSNIQFNANISCGTRFVLCGRAGGRTDIRT